MNNYHPSIFEKNHVIDLDSKTLKDLQNERMHSLNNTTNLPSPQSFSLTPDDTKISKSNTRFLFRNLYGDTLLTDLFFSDTNIENLQKLLKLYVFKESKEIIDFQSNRELMIVMRSIFLEYSLHPPLLNENMSKEEHDRLLLKYKKEVKRLNELVINDILPRVLSQLQQYLRYLEDASTQPTQMELPENVSIAGEREYRTPTQIFFGGDF